MSDVVIRARELSKSYKMYPTPLAKFTDLVGLSRLTRARWPEHVAVDGVNLTISAGERVGIIGRNGAGKSTLLKLITGVIEPTAGMLEITGRTHALLQMGAGFQPEMTGRENARAYLANLGVTGSAANREIEGIIEFSELEEYVDQPMKTYSTGMAMRLIFSVSTTIAPTLFVVDEVLGVGDAYFQAKSFDRIRRLCSEGTTLVLVSHDIYNAARLCDRMLWVEKGRVRFDGDPKRALNLYESSIKVQEEARLRKKALLARHGPTDSPRWGSSYVVELRSSSSEGLVGPVFLSDVSLTIDGGRTLPITVADTDENGISLVEEGSNWQVDEEEFAEGRVTLGHYGSSFQKGSFRVRLDKDWASVSLKITADSEYGQELELIAFDESDRANRIGSIVVQPGAQQTVVIALRPNTSWTPWSDATLTGGASRHGSGLVRVVNVDFIDEHGASVRLLRPQMAVTIKIRYVVHVATVFPSLDAIVTFSKDGVQDVCRLFESPLTLPANAPCGVISISLVEFPLCPGNYSVSVLLADSGYYAQRAGKAYTINDQVYDVLARALEIIVVEGHPAFNGTVVAHRGVWSVCSDAPNRHTRQAGK